MTIHLNDEYKINLSGAGYKLYKIKGIKINKDGEEEEKHNVLGYASSVEQTLGLYLNDRIQVHIKDHDVNIENLKEFILQVKNEILNEYSTAVEKGEVK